ncbi:hypothetical protein BDU57DRAFT_444250 [Ampelomyces quisqualis]|uniref:Uncharacterized protein n=1 Tax=Ampelomyces quisqualis TaxID=50730 RepID=A0A6A5QSP3_AMPQU|nr:hypothetical protein BDU57DRAFT_444250 [Ampelomyces quisqualis]
MYAAVAFETTTVGTLGVLGKEILASRQGMGCVKGGLRWLAVVSMFLSTLYVLSFPTLLAAMTGYIAKSEPYVEDLDRNLIAWDKVDTAYFVVNDATRIGFEKPLVVGRHDDELRAATNDCKSRFPRHLRHVSGRRNCTLTLPDIKSINIADEKLLSQLNTSSTWTLNNNPINLPSPSLNITLYPVNPYPEWEMKSSSVLQYSISGRQSPLYNTTYMLNHSSCKPGETYQWGFSYIFLFMVSIFNFIWSCIMIGMWFDTRRGSRAYQHGRRPGLLRSIVEFAAALREEVGEELVNMEEDEIRERLRRGKARLGVPEGETRIRRVDTGKEHARKRSWTESLTNGSTF